MCAVLVSFGIYLTRIMHLCEFVKVNPSVDPTVLGIFGGLLFSLGAVGRSYMDVATLSTTPELLSLFLFFVVGVADFE